MKIMRKTIVGMFFILAFAWGMDNVRASDIPAQAELIVPSDTLQEGQVIYGLRIRLEEGWKTYWRQVGDAGLPPYFDWKTKKGINGIITLYPAPKRFKDHGLETIGYEHEVVYPLVVWVQGDSLKLQGIAEYVVCREICLPVSQEINAVVSKDPRKTDAIIDKEAIDQAIQNVPQNSGEEAPFAIIKANLVTDGDGSHWEILATSKKGFNKPDLFIELMDDNLEQDVLWHGSNAIHVSQDKKRASIVTSPKQTFKNDYWREEVQLTLVDGDDSVGAWIPITFVETRGAPYSFFLLLLFAFVGGLILNMMPCVLPVLSLKVFSLLHHRENLETRGGMTMVRQSLLLNVLGIYLAFALLGILLFMLKQAGMVAGWGFHFQEPAFVLAMAMVMMLFAANLFGIVTFRLPSGLVVMMQKRGGGEIANGAFATLLATPCSAPFLGVAVGFALAGSAMDLTLIFVSLASGFALPWLMLALTPHAMRLLPRPGAWMVKMERFFAILLCLTALWLLSIFLAQWQGNSPHKSSVWQEFAPEKIDSYVADDKIVFVDVTADWCVTCRVNETLVLERQEAHTLLSQDNVVAMRADWTSRDEFIGAWLSSFGRAGLPFYVVFGKGETDGIVLPELLTFDTIKTALLDAQEGRSINE